MFLIVQLAVADAPDSGAIVAFVFRPCISQSLYVLMPDDGLLGLPLEIDLPDLEIVLFQAFVEGLIECQYAQFGAGMAFLLRKPWRGFYRFVFQAHEVPRHSGLRDHLLLDFYLGRRKRFHRP